MLSAALDWYDAGCSVVRVATDGTKAPAGQWKEYQRRRPGRDQVVTWFADGHPGIGVVCGPVSGGLEMLELEGRAVSEGLVLALREHVEGAGHAELWQRIATGYTETSPSGGLHILYRVDGGLVDGNTKLAERPARDDELTHDDHGLLATKGKRPRRTLLETRGRGGFVVVAPSHGPVHPTGRAWRTVTGTPATIPTITPDERDVLHAAARALDQLPPPPPIPDPVPLDPDHRRGGTPPGEDFNQRATWNQILEPHGWRVAYQQGTRTYWTRPGKAHGVSAVTGGDHGDYLYVWTTSTELPAETALSKWRTYALLNHDGDWSAAAGVLRRQGYGTPAPEPARPVLAPLPTITATPSAAGTLAIVHQPPDTEVESTYARSDDGNALALIDRYGAVLRYCPERGRWLHWTGVRWEWCASGGGHAREYAKRIARALPEDDQAAIRHKARSLGAVGTTAMLTQAATDPRIVVGLDQLDAHPYELNTPTGIIDLRTGTLTPPDPARLHTRITAAAVDEAADPIRWAEFLGDTFGNDQDLITYLQRLVGYSACGRVREHVLPFAFGSGANGKGAFLETVTHVLGDYATTAPAGFLMAKNYASHDTEIARLAGARMVVCSEVNEQDRFDEAKVKALTGGDTLTARFMRQDHVTFTPTHTLWLMGNHQPAVTSGGHSFWRRLRLVPFTRTVPEERRVDDLQGILAREHGAAVLAWIIEGARDYATNGLPTPASVKAATAEYETAQDTVARFVADCCHIGGADHVTTTTSALRAAYERWCLAEGEAAVSPKRLGLELRRLGIDPARTGRARLYRGVALIADENTSPDAGRLDLA
ncbi:phage/plasmid primase, P4 family [Streptoalloteichus tenebrarius]|nr:phage/plasmid primase, P4 family [Streptoalloteichus tenebrarius]